MRTLNLLSMKQFIKASVKQNFLPSSQILYQVHARSDKGMGTWRQTSATCNLHLSVSRSSTTAVTRLNWYIRKEARQSYVIRTQYAR